MVCTKNQEGKQHLELWTLVCKAIVSVSPKDRGHIDKKKKGS